MIVRAACRGYIDLEDYDPRELRSRLKLRWAIREARVEALESIDHLLHAHTSRQMVGTMLRGASDAFAEQSQTRQTIYNRLVQLALPGLAEEFKIDTRTPVQKATDAHAERFGRPGDETYEQMLRGLAAWLDKPPPDAAQREQDREVRRRVRRARRAAAAKE